MLNMLEFSGRWRGVSNFHIFVIIDFRRTCRTSDRSMTALSDGFSDLPTLFAGCEESLHTYHGLNRLANLKIVFLHVHYWLAFGSTVYAY